MAYGFALLSNWFMLLGVGRGHYAFSVRHICDASNFEELSSHIKIELFSCHAVQSNQSEFGFLVSRRLLDGFAIVITWVAAFKKDFINVSCVLLRNL